MKIKDVLYLYDRDRDCHGQTVELYFNSEDTIVAQSNSEVFKIDIIENLEVVSIECVAFNTLRIYLT